MGESEQQPDLAAAAVALRRAARILIAVHHNPDGDAIGSGIALARLLGQLAPPECHLYCSDPTPFNYRFLEDGQYSFVRHIPPGSFDCSCILDASELDRAVPPDIDRNRLGTIINIDHHLTADRFGDINSIDSTAAATAILIAELAEELNLPIDQAMAMAIYTGIITDTGSFRYANTDGRALRWAARLLEAGVDPREVAEQVYETMPPQRYFLLARCLDGMEVSADGKWAAITIWREDMREHAATPDMLDGFINYPRSIAGVEVAVQFRQHEDDGWKISFRSRGNVNVAAIAARFGGGGHFNAAGGFLRGSKQEVQRQVMNAIEKELISVN